MGKWKRQLKAEFHPNLICRRILNGRVSIFTNYDQELLSRQMQSRSAGRSCSGGTRSVQLHLSSNNTFVMKKSTSSFDRLWWIAMVASSLTRYTQNYLLERKRSKYLRRCLRWLCITLPSALHSRKNLELWDLVFKEFNWGKPALFTSFCLLSRCPL